MAGILMALVLSVVVGGLAWLALGNRFSLDDDLRQNEVLNVGLYVLLAFPPVFALVLIWSP